MLFITSNSPDRLQEWTRIAVFGSTNDAGSRTWLLYCHFIMCSFDLFQEDVDVHTLRVMFLPQYLNANSEDRHPVVHIYISEEAVYFTRGDAMTNFITVDFSLFFMLRTAALIRSLTFILSFNNKSSSYCTAPIDVMQIDSLRASYLHSITSLCYQIIRRSEKKHRKGTSKVNHTNRLLTIVTKIGNKTL